MILAATRVLACEMSFFSLAVLMLICTAQKVEIEDRKTEAGLDCPIGPLGTGLGPRVFRGPKALDQTKP